ncbi:MAG: hypothetical protein JRD88_10255, partial [Deltaproteobacteria bacterium]|nr:hypothetical protein [Deltaproteobacteria bacterium]
MNKVVKEPIAIVDAPDKYDERRQQRLINDIMELLVTHYGGSLSENALDQ